MASVSTSSLPHDVLIDSASYVVFKVDMVHENAKKNEAGSAIGW
jgi:hypothetical protein